MNSVKNAVTECRNLSFMKDVGEPLLLGTAVAGVSFAAWKLFQAMRGHTPAPAPAPIPADPKKSVEEHVVDETSPFNNYNTVDKIHGTPVVITGLSTRPLNLFLKALGIKYKGSPGTLFAIDEDPKKLRDRLEDQKNKDKVVSISAAGQKASATLDGKNFKEIKDLSTVLGNGKYQITYGEIAEMLQSQKIFVAPVFPLKLYQALKKAMLLDNMIILPGNDGSPLTLKALIKDTKNKNTAKILQDVEKNPEQYDLTRKGAEELLSLTIYQLGSLVVKREDYHVFVDENMRILDRKPKQNDAVRLINACGIRGFRETDPPHRQEVLTGMFSTALQAAEEGILIVPAVGLGVWKGDPNIYWRSFLDAVVSSETPLDTIYVNPGHHPTPSGDYTGGTGNEFEIFLQAYKTQYASSPDALEKLNKIKNLNETKQDIIQLARRLKPAFPERMISVLNASDPDVTLGYHVGEYVNNVPHTNTTEENYTAIGSNGLCFETITGVHETPGRVVQAK